MRAFNKNNMNMELTSDDELVPILIQKKNILVQLVSRKKMRGVSLLVSGGETSSQI